MKKENPWRDLPSTAPFLLPGDKDLVDKFNESAPEDLLIHHELLPEPFIGSPQAPVVLLNKNPGYSSPNDLAKHPLSQQARLGLLHECEIPFYLLDERERQSLGYRWWNRKLKSLIEACGDQVVARSVLCVEFFPYHSRRFGHDGLALPSQQYSFSLVRSAMSQGAVIVVMRGRKQWLNALPELKSHTLLFHLRNPQNPTISPNNCPDGYESIVEAIGDA